MADETTDTLADDTQQEDQLAKLAEDMGVELDMLKAAAAAADEIVAPVFLQKMAEYGYAVENQEVADELLKIATLVRLAKDDGKFVPEPRPGADDVPVLKHASEQLQAALTPAAK